MRWFLCSLLMFVVLPVAMADDSVAQFINEVNSPSYYKIAELQALAKTKPSTTSSNVKEQPLYASQSKKLNKQKSKKSSERGKSPSHWKGSNVSLGIVLNTGNSDNTNVNFGSNVDYKNGPYFNALKLYMQLERSLGVVTEEKYFAGNQFRYYFNRVRKSYIFNDFNYTRDRFSPYGFQTVGSVGYGRDLVRTDHFLLSAQAGPGARWTRFASNNQDRFDPVAVTQTDIKWQINKNLLFTEKISYDIGSPYNYLKAITAVSNKINKHLALQLSYMIEYYSSIPPESTNTKNLDTTTNVSIVYNFS